MSDFFEVSRNIYIPKEGHEFGVFNITAISELLCSVDLFFSNSMETIPFSSKTVFLKYKDDRPHCYAPDEGDKAHLITISARGDCWCRWIYEFSHEYCHHLIDGKMIKDDSGLMWFEEALCRAASIACLANMVTVCYHSHNISLVQFYPCVISYINNLLLRPLPADILNHLPSVENPDRHDMIPLDLWMKRDSAPIVAAASVSGYNDSLYDLVAIDIYPHLHNNPRLWKILLHIGDSCSWQSLDALYQHLSETADDSYRDSLSLLFRCLGVEC